MSEADAQEGAIVSAHGVTVEKSFEPEEFPVPAIAFAIRSERDEAVSVRVVETIPEEVSTADVGFHPNYGEEFWSVEPDRIIFERDFEANGEYTTVYGLRAQDTDNVERFLGAPEIDEVDPPLDDESEDSSQVVRDVIAGDDEDEGADEADEDGGVEPLELNDPNEEGTTTEETDTVTEAGEEMDDLDDAVAQVEDGEEADADDLDDVIDDIDEVEDVETSADADTSDVGGAAVEDVAAALADQLRSGDVDEDDLEVLREELDLGTGSTEARIQHLQNELSDLSAYTESLEEFLDENGTAQQLLEDLQDDIESFEEDIEEALGRSKSNTETLDDVESQVGELRDGLDQVEDVEGRLEEFEERLDEMREEVEEMGELQQRLQSVFAGDE